MLNSSSSIIPPFFKAPDTTLSNTTNAGFTMSINFVTFLSFFWYFLVSVEVIQLAIAPVSDAAPNAVLTGIPMNVANVATLERGVSQDTGGRRLAKKSHREVGGSRIFDWDVGGLDFAGQFRDVGGFV